MWPSFFPSRAGVYVPFPWVWAGLWLVYPIELAEVTLCDFWSWAMKGDAASVLFSGILLLGTQSYNVTSSNALRPPRSEESQATWRCFSSVVLFFASFQGRGQIWEWRYLHIISIAAVESLPPSSLPSWGLRHHGTARSLPYCDCYYESWSTEFVSIRKWLF